MFKMINEDFVCENCGKNVEKLKNGSARNHCPNCLYSKHLDDKFPGDRNSDCFGLMIPFGIDFKKNKGIMIKHKCQKCGKIILNRLAPDDNIIDFNKKLNDRILGRNL